MSEQLRAAARAVLPEVIDELPSAITSNDPLAGIERMKAIGDRWQALRAALAAAPSHPHDGYAYDGCRCVCCLNVRALAAAPSTPEQGIDGCQFKSPEGWPCRATELEHDGAWALGHHFAAAPSTPQPGIDMLIRQARQAISYLRDSNRIDALAIAQDLAVATDALEPTPSTPEPTWCREHHDYDHCEDAVLAAAPSTPEPKTYLHSDYDHSRGCQYCGTGPETNTPSTPQSRCPGCGSRDCDFSCPD